MNEQIKKLLDQATIDALYETQDAVDLLDNPVSKQQRELQLTKFAKLIVLDIHQYVDSMDTAQVISNGILRRYGVEE
jgi:hypothetical protein